MVGGAHWQASTLGRSGWPPPHRAEPFTDLVAMVGGVHQQASMPGWRGKGADRYHTVRSHSRARSRWWEACIGKRLCLDRGKGVPAAATPRGAVLGLTRNSRRRAPASTRAWIEGWGCWSPRSCSRTRPQRWEARNGGRRAPVSVRASKMGEEERRGCVQGGSGVRRHHRVRIHPSLKHPFCCVAVNHAGCSGTGRCHTGTADHGRGTVEALTAATQGW
jgi:hypothetical protein